MALSDNDRISSSRLSYFAGQLWDKIKSVFVKKTDFENSPAGKIVEIPWGSQEYKYDDIMSMYLAGKTVICTSVDSTMAIKMPMVGYEPPPRTDVGGTIYFTSQIIANTSTVYQASMQDATGCQLWTSESYLYTPVHHIHQASDITTGLATVATSGDYDDLSDIPIVTISTNVEYGKNCILWKLPIPDNGIWERLINVSMATAASPYLQLNLSINVRITNNGFSDHPRITVNGTYQYEEYLKWVQFSVVKDETSNKRFLVMSLEHYNSLKSSAASAVICQIQGVRCSGFESPNSNMKLLSNYTVEETVNLSNTITCPYIGNGFQIMPKVTLTYEVTHDTMYQLSVDSDQSSEIAYIHAYRFAYASTVTSKEPFNDGMVINIPWHNGYGRQIAFEDESHAIYSRYLHTVDGAKTWSEWRNLLDIDTVDGYHINVITDGYIPPTANTISFLRITDS